MQWHPLFAKMLRPIVQEHFESAGVWGGQTLLRPVLLIDSKAVPVERESVPLHPAGEAFPETEGALARVIVDEPGFWELYGSLLAVLHPNVFEEANRMATTKGKRGDLDLGPFVEKIGLKKYLEAVAMDDIIATVGPKKLAKKLGMEPFLASLTAEERRELKERLSIGAKTTVKELGVERFLASLTAAELRELKERLK